MKNIYKYILGYMRVTIVCADTGKFMTRCAKEGIHIWNIRRTDDITVEMCIYSYQHNELNYAAQKSGAKCSIMYKKGLPEKLKIIKSRKFFAVGFLLFLLCVLLFSSFVTEITVTGNETVSEQEIVQLLNSAGFKKGMLIYNIDTKQIQKNIIGSYDKLAWIWIDLNGTKAHVSVKERTPVPDIANPENYSNCVASRDGVIIEIMPRYGRQIVRPGDVVKKGDLLISGISETKTGQIRYIHADGIVTARTWYNLSGEYSRISCNRYLTGRSKKLYNINIGDYVLPLTNKNVEYDKYQVTEDNKKICSFLNLSFTINTYCEIIEENVTISDDEVVSKAKNALEQQLNAQLVGRENLEIVNRTCEYSTNDSGNIDVEVTFECIEDIAQYKALSMPEGILEEHNGENSSV